MVYPIRSSAAEAAQSALFNYLNLNRHKFDERGRLNSRSIAQDYIPHELAHPMPKFPSEPEAIEINSESPDWFDPDGVDTWDDENAMRAWEYEKLKREGRRLDRKDCREIWRKERNRCQERWSSDQFAWLWPKAYSECFARSIDRHRWCYYNGEMPAHITEYGAYDASKQPKGERDPDRTRPQKREGLPQASWAVTPVGRSKSPIAEGPDSSSLPGFEASLPILRRIPRIRVTPGIGFGGVVRGGGGKRPLMPYNPLDPLAPMKLY